MNKRFQTKILLTGKIVYLEWNKSDFSPQQWMKKKKIRV